MDRKRLVLLVAPLGVLAVAAAFGPGLAAEVSRGEHPFWLAELWPPAAVLTIVAVVCIDLWSSAESRPPKPAAPPRKRRR